MLVALPPNVHRQGAEHQSSRCNGTLREALPNIGFYLKRKMGGRHNLLFGLTNDALGYMLTEEDFDSFPRYAYVSRTSLGEKTGRILIEESLKLVAQPAPQ